MKYTYIRAFGVLFAVSLFLSGCLYPDNELAKNQVPNEDQLELVQKSVNEYREKTNGLVPIKTKEQDTPIFQKYLVDFTALKEKHLLTEIPGNAYENGGVYQYTLITPEDNPRVKLIDLRITETIRKVSVQLDIYRNEHLYPPYGDQIANGIYKLNYKKLGFDSEPVVESPYSQKNLPIIMDTEGKIYVDYRMDLYEALTEGKHDYKEGDDIRYLLAENTPFVPVYSLPYTVHDGEPVFLHVNK
ncbi:hypothetical protein F3157_09555 [Virgibacillus dakarensis]|uniref:ABC transporter periplasmic binding protein yphF n=1 Tax=Lentibacillus populi TaxID=1827502 RepID=A0A9W5X486_9BACI|nr:MULTISPECIES: hypothetical protein [Bacillaceae]MBT2214274.1 hypothetical protein [Virgibacillus dakarensis]MTW85901.1 hypothetical protein [Virgibacillus dakarensis]GGB33534.1 hypothetical protein GCM10011409_08700 [Lentibacillus populi]